MSLVSREYASRRKLQIHDDRIRLAFADNREGFTIGSVIVQLSFQKSKDVECHAIESRERLVRLQMSSEIWAKFYVVERLVEHVILGADFLEEHHVLEHSKDAFLDLPESPDLLATVQGILQLNDFERKLAQGAHQLKKKFRSGREAAIALVNLEEQLELEDQQENARREREDLRILAMEDREDRRRAEGQELQTRQAYDTNRRQKLAQLSTTS